MPADNALRTLHIVGTRRSVTSPGGELYVYAQREGSHRERALPAASPPSLPPLTAWGCPNTDPVRKSLKSRKSPRATLIRLLRLFRPRGLMEPPPLLGFYVFFAPGVLWAHGGLDGADLCNVHNFGSCILYVLCIEFWHNALYNQYKPQVKAGPADYEIWEDDTNGRIP